MGSSDLSSERTVVHAPGPVLRVSACRPGPELLRVPYCPDVLDPVACDLEREHRHDAVELGRQAGLTVDRTLEDCGVDCPADDPGVEARDLPGTLDRAQGGGNESSAIGGRGGVGVEDVDEGIDVPGFPCLFEVPDEAGLAGWRGRTSAPRDGSALE